MEDAETLLKKAQDFETRGLFWEAGEEYKNALLEFNKLSGLKDEKALCKRKIREMNIKKASDFKEVVAEHQFTEEQTKQLRELVDWFVNQETVSKSLRLIGSDLHFHPNYQRIKNKSQSEMPLTFMIASLSSQDSEGNLQRDGHDGVAMSYSMFYDIDQTQIISLHLIPIMQKLIEAKMDYESLSDYFKSSELFSENMLNIFNVGLERFLAHDYVSSVQILSPLFEKTFMDITEAIGGADTVASRTQKGSQDQVWTQDKVLGEDFLKDETVQKIWGEDFCEQINFVLFSPLGYKLRHKVAHGYASFKEYNFANNVLILYFYLVIVARVKRIEKSDSN